MCKCPQSWAWIWPDTQHGRLGPERLCNSEHDQASHVSLSFSVWVQGRGEWANMTLTALCRSQHESRAFLWTERTDCVVSSWNACRSLFGVVLAGIVLLDCSRSGRTRTESEAPSLYFWGPVFFLLFLVEIIKRNPIHSEFFNPVLEDILVKRLWIRPEVGQLKGYSILENFLFRIIGGKAGMFFSLQLKAYQKFFKILYKTITKILTH